jgi:hypothetical protein
MKFDKITDGKVLYNFVVHHNIQFELQLALIAPTIKATGTVHLKFVEQHSNNFSSLLIHLFPWPNSTLNTQLVNRRGKFNSPWSPTNPRVRERDGEGPIHMEDAPLLAPLGIPNPICWISPRGFGAAVGRSRGGKPWESKGRRKGA